MPQVLYSFFDEYDFSGKTIIPFNVHNGSRFSGTIETIQGLEPEATVITDGFTVNERDVPNAAGDVADWLEESVIEFWIAQTGEFCMKPKMMIKIMVDCCSHYCRLWYLCICKKRDRKQCEAYIHRGVQ